MHDLGASDAERMFSRTNVLVFGKTTGGESFQTTRPCRETALRRGVYALSVTTSPCLPSVMLAFDAFVACLASVPALTADAGRVMLTIASCP